MIKPNANVSRCTIALVYFSRKCCGRVKTTIIIWYDIAWLFEYTIFKRLFDRYHLCIRYPHSPIALFPPTPSPHSYLLTTYKTQTHAHTHIHGKQKGESGVEHTAHVSACVNAEATNKMRRLWVCTCGSNNELRINSCWIICHFWEIFSDFTRLR